MSPRNARHSGDTLPMQVSNMPFLIERMGEDCAPLQYVRELTQNAIEAILALPKRSGDIRWDVDWNTFELTDAYKLAVMDTGVGMTGEEMVQYINRLSSSIREQSTTGNYGVGAKIAAVPRNPTGLVYISWKDGTGYQICLWRDPETGEYGLKKFEWPEGRTEYWAYVDEELKPEPIDRHGTMVVLLGKSDDDDTVTPPEGTAMPSRWILRYLNSRYFEFPKGITVQAREGWTNPRDDSRHNFLRRVTGMKSYLDSASSSSGAVNLTNATAHWWILKPEVDVDAGHYAPRGHISALYQDELYEMQTGRSGISRLQEFGVIFGTGQVVIYVRPEEKNRKLTTNTARTHLLVEGETLPWSDWATEFREKMPAQIVAFMEQLSAKVPSDNREAIKERLKAIRELFQFSRYRQVKHGPFFIDERDLLPGGGSEKTGGNGQRRKPRPGTGDRRGEPGANIYTLFQAKKGAPAGQARHLLEPTVQWITVENGTRTAGDLEDRSARYIPSQHLLLINSDFRVFKDMIDRWCKRYSHIKGIRPTVETVVREWFEQQLIEAILGAHSLREATSQWTSVEMEHLWGEEALTAVVLPRYHVDVSVKRALGQKLGSLREHSAEGDPELSESPVGSDLSVRQPPTRTSPGV